MAEFCLSDYRCICDGVCDAFSCSTCYQNHYGYSCTCNDMCYGDTLCSCYQTCDAEYYPCTCNASCYGNIGCQVCHYAAYDRIPCHCDSTCYLESTNNGSNPRCSCDMTCHLETFTSYDPAKRDKNNCYIYVEGSWSKPLYTSGLQELIDRIKTAGTIAIINPLD